MRKHGKWGRMLGYGEYRYGNKPKKIERIYKGDARNHKITEVMNALRDWRLSHFENEGAVFHGLRSALCLEGHSFARSEREASSLISAAFTYLGYARPSWEQGQREYSLPEEYCNWCYTEMPEEQWQGIRKARFCSPVCAKAALEHRDFERTLRDSAIARSAQAIIRREALPERQCKFCLKMFKPFNPDSRDLSFCSRECADQSRRKYSEIPCGSCGKLFRQMKADHRYCSSDCFNTASHPTECKQCHKRFIAKRFGAMFCSNNCSQTYRRAEEAISAGKTYIPLGSTIRKNCRICGSDFMTARHNAFMCSRRCQKRLESIKKAKRISPHVFDWFFKCPLEGRRSNELTAQRFDWIAINQGLRVTMERAV
ncbi:hypothetical protein KUG47_12945 [Falsochrobactrum sp. TDYN1]|uniref:Uncharacterized protein n=1 Tax=Falsochrobactrum tianjinense TaxID=2706015 RepID=A0A949PQY6_9HYPH|nr:hypothetical protein [Falsochrobactrum sp. TDYN1]MBV2144401.1 hypothetical protein [Falsochrobactrum sp. TDYN1]